MPYNVFGGTLNPTLLLLLRCKTEIAFCAACVVCSFPRQRQLPRDRFVRLDSSSVERARRSASETDAGPPRNGDGRRFLAQRKISGICGYGDKIAHFSLMFS